MATVLDSRRAESGFGLTLERLELDRCDWEKMDGFEDRVVFQSREWLEFLAHTQGAEPMVAAVLQDSDVVGYFTGAIVRHYGVRVLGSPLPGWSTSHMGFNLVPGVSRAAAMEALARFAFGPLRCLHMELKDRELTVHDAPPARGFVSDSTVMFEVDLTGDEHTIFGRMSSACRRAIRKGEKVGVTVQEASGEEFADEYHAQLEQVFARQALRPTYDAARVRELIRSLDPSGRLLLLRAIGPGGDCVATGIFPAMNRTAYFWGGASLRSQQILRPNEALFWYAMRYWRSRGMRRMDLGGDGDYKRRYGPLEHSIPFVRRSRVSGLETLRELARRAAEARHRLPRRSLPRGSVRSV